MYSVVLTWIAVAILGKPTSYVAFPLSCEA